MTAPPRYDFSRLWRRALHVGQTTDWQPSPKSPAQRFKGVLRIITITILSLALAGSMQSVLQQSSGDWYAALARIALHSTLSEIITWLGGLLFAFAVVLTAQALSHYVAERVIEIVAVMQSNAGNKDVRALEAAGLTGAAALLARLKERQRERRSGLAMASAIDMPSLTRSQGPVSGTFRVAEVPDVPTSIRGEKRSKVGTAVDMLTADRNLRKLSNRALQARTGIGRNTWSAAKRRIGR
jgi:hypothetical protein